ncbi:hypothetical protein R3W88_024517 [Solanum pinnatisectum]|uniref:Uncharacterized protein n=1 Tax=Solanum pinnatisectum TaxID=50273 RepID=A0AAV9M0S3_9SOLN|nr:hypothetical protein R3W88_024517 [Solanum pinnatisectum]
MRGLSNHDFQGIQSRVTMIRTQLKELQEQMRYVQDDNQVEQYQMEKRLKTQLEKWRNIEESATKQKARVLWLKEGDSNTTYFHACMKHKQAQNHITRLTDAVGTIIQDAKGIQKEILSFYRALLGTAAKQLTPVQPHIMELGPVLNREQQLALIAKVTTEDVYNALLLFRIIKPQEVMVLMLYFIRRHGL